MYRSIGLVLCCMVASARSQSPDMYGIINILYLKADPNMDGKISLENMTSVYLALDFDDSGFVSRQEFVNGWTGITLQTKEMANAYFDLSDTDHNGRIDQRDTETIFKQFDENGDGNVSDDEFVHHYTQIYHAVPFVILYRRLQQRDGNDDEINRNQFQSMFQCLKPPAIGPISKASLEREWVKENFGTPHDADAVVTSLDLNGDDVISVGELGSRFDLLDKRDAGRIGLDEIKKIMLVPQPQSDDDALIG